VRASSFQWHRTVLTGRISFYGDGYNAKCASFGLSHGARFHIRGLTRKPDSERAAALARQGVDIVKGDLDDEATLRRALAGAWGVFGVQNAVEAGVEREEAQGKRLAALAREAGVKHYVSTSRLLQFTGWDSEPGPICSSKIGEFRAGGERDSGEDQAPQTKIQKLHRDSSL
jgi:hypothetical protein